MLHLLKKQTTFLSRDLRALIMTDPSWATSESLKAAMRLAGLILEHVLLPCKIDVYKGPDGLKRYLCESWAEWEEYQQLMTAMTKAVRMEIHLDVDEQDAGAKLLHPIHAQVTLYQAEDKLPIYTLTTIIQRGYFIVMEHSAR